MPNARGVIGIAIVALALVLTPGPNMAYLVSRSVAQGRRAGFISLFGVATGFLVYLLAAVSGLAAIFAVVPSLYLGLKLAGAAYLLWIAWNTVRGATGGAPGGALAPVMVDGSRRLFAMGLVTNLLNPKIAILYVSVLPQFVDPSRGEVGAQSLVLGLVQITVAVTINGLIVVTAGATASFITARPAWERARRYVSGTVLAALAIRVATDRSRAAAAA